MSLRESAIRPGGVEPAPPRRWLPGTAVLLAYLFAAGLTSLFVLTVATHLRDRFALSHVDGVWLNLALAARSGSIPPPLLEDGVYSGTRYLPLPVTMLSVVGRVMGDDIAAGKLLALLSFALLLLVAGLLLHRLRVPAPVIAVLLTLVAATPTGHQAALTIRFDALPAALQLAALTVLVLAAGRHRPATLLAMGVLCGAAPALKTSALWGALTVLLWLLAQRQVRQAGLFLAATVVTFAGLFLPFVVASDGGVLSQLRATSASGEDPLWRVDRSLLHLANFATSNDMVTVPLLVGATAVALLVLYQRRCTPLHLALLLAFLQVFVLSADRGIETNHLIDMVVLAVVVVGLALGTALRTARDPAPTLLVALVGLTLMAVGGSWMQWRVVETAVVAGLRGQSDAAVARDPLAGLVPLGAPLLSEDPGIPVVRGQQSVVGDPFLFRRLSATRPQWSADLVRRIRAHEFEAVVLLQVSPDVAATWYDEVHFGGAVGAAIKGSYALEQTLPNGQLLYRPAVRR